MDIGRAGHQAEIDMVAADGDRMVRIARRQGEFRRRMGHQFHDQRPVHPDHLIGPVDLRTRLGIEVQRLVAIDLQPVALDHVQARLVDRLNLIGR